MADQQQQQPQPQFHPQQQQQPQASGQAPTPMEQAGAALGTAAEVSAAGTAAEMGRTMTESVTGPEVPSRGRGRAPGEDFGRETEVEPGRERERAGELSDIEPGSRAGRRNGGRREEARGGRGTGQIPPEDESYEDRRRRLGLLDYAHEY